MTSKTTLNPASWSHTESIVFDVAVPTHSKLLHYQSWEKPQKIKARRVQPTLVIKENMFFPSIPPKTFISAPATIATPSTTQRAVGPVSFVYAPFYHCWES